MLETLRGLAPLAIVGAAAGGIATATGNTPIDARPSNLMSRQSGIGASLIVGGLIAGRASGGGDFDRIPAGRLLAGVAAIALGAGLITQAFMGGSFFEP